MVKKMRQVTIMVVHLRVLLEESVDSSYIRRGMAGEVTHLRMNGIELLGHHDATYIHNFFLSRIWTATAINLLPPSITLVNYDIWLGLDF